MRSPPCTTWSTTDGLMLMVMKMLVVIVMMMVRITLYEMRAARQERTREGSRRRKPNFLILLRLEMQNCRKKSSR